MTYSQAVATHASLQHLVKDWDKCPVTELGIRVRALALFGFWNELPQTTFIQYQQMRAKWEAETGLRKRGGLNA